MIRPPVPRSPIADPGLTRPDWTATQPRDPGRLWLDKNENGDPAMAAVVADAVAAVGREAQYAYPDLGPVYARLARWVGLEAAELMLSAGSDGAIRTVFEAFVREGDAVVHTRPTFAMYDVYCRIYGARQVGVAYAAGNAGPILSADDILAAIRDHKPRLVCLPNPDSPTGTVLAPESLRAVIEAAGRVGAVMLVDEAYHPFHPETCIGWIREYPHLVVVRSTGKAWGMAGFRIGYAAAAGPLARLLHQVKGMYEVGTFSAAVFARMLERTDAMAASVARLQAGKAAFIAALADLGFATHAGHGNFLHVAFGAKADAVHAALADLVYYRRDFAEPCLQGFSRFTATTPERFAPVIDRLRKAMEK